MNVSDLIEKTELHDGLIKSMQLYAGRFIAEIGNISIDIENDDQYTVFIELNVESASRNGIVVSTFITEAEGSSIIQFKRSGNLAFLIVDWHNYLNKTSETQFYEFVFNNFNLRYELS